LVSTPETADFTLTKSHPIQILTKKLKVSSHLWLPPLPPEDIMALSTDEIPSRIRRIDSERGAA
jgi:hypothetical protein